MKSTIQDTEMQMDKLTSASQGQGTTVRGGDAGISPPDLYLKTFEELKKEIAASVTDARSTERNTLLLCAGIIAYISGHCGSPAIEVARFLPLVLAAFGAFRVAALMLSVNPRAQYLKALEKDFLTAGYCPAAKSSSAVTIGAASAHTFPHGLEM